jgi:hypothetical protein
MPIPIEGGDDDDHVPKFSESELSIILHKSYPRSWGNAQVSANFRYLSLTHKQIISPVSKTSKTTNPTTGMVKEIIVTIAMVIDKTIISINLVTTRTTTIEIITAIIILARNIAVFMVTAPIPPQNVYW